MAARRGDGGGEEPASGGRGGASGIVAYRSLEMAETLPDRYERDVVQFGVTADGGSLPPMGRELMHDESEK